MGAFKNLLHVAFSACDARRTPYDCASQLKLLPLATVFEGPFIFNYRSCTKS